MTSPGDPDALAARHPGTSPAQLAEIAVRRWDLHPVIHAHPHAHPGLRQWIAQVNPRPGQSRVAPHGPQYGPAYGPAYGPPGPSRVPAHGPAYGPAYGPVGSGSLPSGPAYPAGWTTPRRSGSAGWLAGCGCLALAVVVIGVLLLGAVGATLSSDEDRPSDRSPSTGNRDGRAADALRAGFDAERKKYHRLAAVLDGNPVAPLITHPVAFSRLEEQAERPGLSDYAVRSLVQQARRMRRELQRAVAAAEKRRVNRSGSLTEELVDRATDGFIDTRWDAASACPGAKEKGRITTGCVKGRALVVHLLPESELDGEWEMRMLVAHELAHVYQRADRARFKNYRGRADRLVGRGLFQGSREKMADCYALTYYGRWTLSQGSTTYGYGYVCGQAERTAIRSWAADLDAPMPG